MNNDLTELKDVSKQYKETASKLVVIITIISRKPKKRNIY